MQAVQLLNCYLAKSALLLPSRREVVKLSSGNRAKSKEKDGTDLNAKQSYCFWRQGQGVVESCFYPLLFFVTTSRTPCYFFSTYRYRVRLPCVHSLSHLQLRLRLAFILSSKRQPQPTTGFNSTSERPIATLQHLQHARRTLQLRCHRVSHGMLIRG